ncbi:MAG: phosphate ABC transporter substrate-binding protein PstS [Chloroflexi bacterium]|nr:phosphate ABC transporter substrate-binding protein PstS [Chloroflexota bacterium]
MAASAKPSAAASTPASVAAAPSSAPASAAASTAASAGAAAGSAAAFVPPKLPGIHLTGAGSTFDQPLFTKVFDDFNKATGAQVDYSGVGSGAGIQQLTNKTVDFGASDAIMTADQDAAAKAAGGPALHIPITIGAVAVGYNLKGVNKLNLDGPTLAGIYMGTIKAWNDPKIAALNSGTTLPNTPIAVVYRSDGSGTSYIFTNYLSAVSADWKSQVGAGTTVKWPVGIGGNGSPGVAGQVSQTPGALGYFELAYAKQNNISAVTMMNQAGKLVDPSSDSAAAAAAGAAANLPPDGKAIFVNAPGDATYPISGFSWVLVYQNQADPNKGPAVVTLLKYLVTTGQQSSTPLFYAPLPPSVQDLDMKLIASMTINGKPQ